MSAKMTSGIACAMLVAISRGVLTKRIQAQPEVVSAFAKLAQ